MTLLTPYSIIAVELNKPVCVYRGSDHHQNLLLFPQKDRENPGMTLVPTTSFNFKLLPLTYLLKVPSD